MRFANSIGFPFREGVCPRESRYVSMGKTGDLERPFSIPLIGRGRDASGEIVKRRGEWSFC